LSALPHIELRPIESLVAYARNARTHSPEQISQLKASLIEFGWTNSVLADDVGIVAGHGRVMAASELYQHGRQIKFPNGAPIPHGMVPVVDCTGWTPAQRRAYIIADNKLALNAGWDDDLLRLEIADLKSDSFDLNLTGFTSDELNELLGVADLEIKEVDPDDAPEAQEQAVSVPGDVWVLGAHRVMCGSSLEVDSWDKLMAGEKADICWTDPPYNVAYEGKAGSIKNDDMSDGEFRQFLLDAFTAAASALKPGAPVYIAHADGTPGEAFRWAFRQSGLKLSGALIWRKNQFTLSRSDYQWQHEAILYGWKPGSKHRWYGGRKLTTMLEMGEGSPFTRLDDGRWSIRIGDAVMVVAGDVAIEEHPSSIIFHDKPQRSDQHPTMKPVGLVEKMLRASARSGDIVIDGFGGSGSTLIAADRMGMSARLMELEPRFVDVIVRRWQTWSGRRAVHALTGAPFPD
jgi:DNA modification methylase